MGKVYQTTSLLRFKDGKLQQVCIVEERDMGYEEWIDVPGQDTPAPVEEHDPHWCDTYADEEEFRSFLGYSGLWRESSDVHHKLFQAFDAERKYFRPGMKDVPGKTFSEQLQLLLTCYRLNCGKGQRYES